MITIEKLNDFGANTNEGLERCMQNQDLYLNLVNKFLNDNTFDKLKQSIINDDLEEAFKYAHALKGVLANLSLTPLYKIVSELTEFLRNKEAVDYNQLLDSFEIKINELKE